MRLHAGTESRPLFPGQPLQEPSPLPAGDRILRAGPRPVFAPARDASVGEVAPRPRLGRKASSFRSKTDGGPGLRLPW
jgi:hypothetical protein